MTITWKTDELPIEPTELGHGVCVLGSGTTDLRSRVVAFVEGFGWLTAGSDAVVRFDPRYFPAGESLRLVIEDLVRTGRRRLDGKIAPGFLVHVNG